MRHHFLICLFSGSFATRVLAAPPLAPSGLTAVAPSGSTIRLDWMDNSADESGFEIYYRVGTTGSFLFLTATEPDTAFLEISSAAPNTLYQFRIRAYLLPVPEYSDYDGPVGVTTPLAVTSSSYRGGKLQTPFSFNLTSSNQAQATSYAVSALPDGLTLNPTTGAITGTPSTVGRTSGTVTITHSGLPNATAPLIIEVFMNPPALQVPVVTAPPQDRTLALGTPPVTLAAEQVFQDPDVSSAARLTTDLGPLDFAFYPDAAPQTVANFLGYLNRGDFLNTIFHRSVSGFVIQGGAFRADATASAVPTQPPVVNEPRITNVRGTVAMAKLGSSPDSATNQFFVNLADNSSNLDNQNEGFTVFGRVAGNGMAVADAIAALPLQNYSTTNGALTAVPVRISPPPVGAVPYDPANLVPFRETSRLAPLTYAAVSLDSAVATVAVVGNTVTISPVSPGTATVTLTATDLDAQPVSTSFAVTVSPDTYELWTARQNFLLPADAAADADPDRDASINLVEYALVSPPLASSPPDFSPEIVENHLTADFTLRRYISGVSVSLETASSLSGPWTTPWNLTDGFAHPWIFSHENTSDLTRITVRDPAALTDAALFLRLRISRP